MLNYNSLFRSFFIIVLLLAIGGCASSQSYRFSSWALYEEDMIGKESGSVCEEIIKEEENYSLIPECEMHLGAYAKAHEFCSMCDEKGRSGRPCMATSRIMWVFLSSRKKENGVEAGEEDMLFMCEPESKFCIPFLDSLDDEQFTDLDSFPGYACRGSSSS